MALILRRTSGIFGRVYFEMHMPPGNQADDVVLSMPAFRWEKLGMPEALAITYEAYEEPRK